MDRNDYIHGIHNIMDNYSVAAKSNSYSLVVSGAGLWNGDKDEMVKILQANKLFAKNSVYTFTYDTDTGGTRKMSYQNAIDTAYSECTINDTAFFFHKHR